MLEERVAQLEKEVAELKEQVSAQPEAIVFTLNEEVKRLTLTALADLFSSIKHGDESSDGISEPHAP